MESCHQCHGIPYHVLPSHIHIISHMFIPFIYSHMVHDITIFWMKPNLPGADWDMMRFCCSGLATELLDVDATAHLPALCAWPQRSWQRQSEKVTKIQLSHYCFDCQKKKLKSAVLQFTKCKILYMPLLVFAQKQVFTPDIRGDDHNTTI